MFISVDAFKCVHIQYVQRNASLYEQASLIKATSFELWIGQYFPSECRQGELNKFGVMLRVRDRTWAASLQEETVGIVLECCFWERGGFCRASVHYGVCAKKTPAVDFISEQKKDCSPWATFMQRSWRMGGGGERRRKSATPSTYVLRGWGSIAEKKLKFLMRNWLVP
jgi:hypothetical protein